MPQLDAQRGGQFGGQLGAHPGGQRDAQLGRQLMVKRRLSVVVDPTACDAHGTCAELLPERIHLDPWGYPVIDATDIPPELREHAQRAVASCPRLALHLVERREP